MYAVFYTMVMVLLWVINLFNGTGYGMTYHTTEISMIAAVVVGVICLASQSLKDGDVMIKPRYFYTIMPLTVLILGILFIYNYSLLDIRAFWGFLIVYILSKTRPSATAIRMTAICYGVLGLSILFIYNYLDVLKGWNENSIAMIGLFSFLVFTIPFFGMREWRSFIMMPLIGTAYIFLIIPTDSRSCILMIIIQVLIVLRIVPVRKTLESKKGLFIFLQIPLIIAILVVLMSAFGDLSGLKEWSYEKFEKPLFNGRDELWLEGFRALKERPLFGNGNLRYGQWHNCAITSLVSTGIVGYVLWVRMFYLILKEGRPYVDDICVIGGMVSFLVLYCQQSVELGLFAYNPNIIPYIILGIILGRVNYVKERRGLQ